MVCTSKCKKCLSSRCDSDNLRFRRGTNYYDGSMAITQCGIPSGESMVYNFTVRNIYMDTNDKSNPGYSLTRAHTV